MNFKEKKEKLVKEFNELNQTITQAQRVINQAVQRQQQIVGQINLIQEIENINNKKVGEEKNKK